MIKLSRTLIFFLLLISLSSCSSIGSNTGSDTGLGGTRFYSLNALPPASDSTTNNQLKIGIGPISIPRLLNRPQIVSRQSNTEIKMSEIHQWGGSYKEDLIQVMTDNLSSLLKTERIEQYPWKFSFKPHYQARINIERLDGELGKNVVLKARWRLIKNGKEILVKRAVVTTPTNGITYNHYVKAQSQALTTFSKQIVTQINQLN